LRLFSLRRGIYCAKIRIVAEIDILQRYFISTGEIISQLVIALGNKPYFIETDGGNNIWFAEVQCVGCRVEETHDNNEG